MINKNIHPAWKDHHKWRRGWHSYIITCPALWFFICEHDVSAHIRFTLTCLLYIGCFYVGYPQHISLPWSIIALWYSLCLVLLFPNDIVLWFPHSAVVVYFFTYVRYLNLRFCRLKISVNFVESQKLLVWLSLWKQLSSSHI